MDLTKTLEFLKISGRKLLIYHKDCDGLCSATLILKFFKDFEPIPREGPIIDKKFFKMIISKKPSLILILDIPIDQEWKKIKELENRLKETKFLIIDHHIPEKNLNSAKIIHINPRFEKNIYLPASYLVYRILENLEKKVKQYLWISATGVIGDHAYEECKDLLGECSQIYPDLLNRDILNSKIMSACNLISAAVTLKGTRGANKVLDFLVESENYESFVSIPRLKKWGKIVEREIEKILLDFSRNREEYGNLLIYEIKSRLNLTSIISSILTNQYPDKIIIITKAIKGGTKVSFRCEKGINVGKLVKKIIKGLGSGGGHEKAAGALVKDWEEFKRRIIENLSLHQ